MSAAFNVDKTNEIKVMKEKKVIVTRDFVRKMLHIHERKECCMPVVIEGETGVGKTFLLDVLSTLWNESWHLQLNKQREVIKVSDLLWNFLNMLTAILEILCGKSF